ncbi:hypothetical protein [Streptomyces sp. NPDC046821]|uniref:hypothetical protein n=1 Tax=Streptomyces sp. NPDC046821 TaxID=3154702 RepID=UPI0033DB5F59
MTSAEGYHVAHGGMSGQAGELDGSGDDVARIREAVTSPMRYAEDVLGGSDTGAAFTSFAAAWEAETKVLEEALHELADKVRLADHAYGGSDIDVRNNTDRVRVVPLPAQAERPSALSGY